MKKNRMMRIAAVMLVLALITTCVISGTFAKYVTNSKTATSNARVAKWGVTVSATGTAFGTHYVAKEAGNSVDSSPDDNDSCTVKAFNTDMVVAPGTKGTMASVVISGQPEVACTVAYDATITLNGWEVDGDAYCPLIFKIVSTNVSTNGTTTSTATYKIADGETAQDFADRVAAVLNAIGKTTTTDPETGDPVTTGTIIPANTNLANTYSRTLTWEWPFEGDDDSDTALGNAAAQNLTNAATISFSVAASVTQVD